MFCNLMYTERQILFQSSVLSRGHTGEPFEVFPEKRLGGEVEVVGYFLYVHGRIAQEVLGFEDDILVNPFSCAASAYLFDNGR